MFQQGLAACHSPDIGKVFNFSEQIKIRLSVTLETRLRTFPTVSLMVIISRSVVNLLGGYAKN